MLQNATALRKSAPGLPNRSDEHVSCTAPAWENASLQILFKCPTPAIVFGNSTKPSRFAHVWQGAQSLAPATQNDASTSKSGANMWCFVHIDFEICFAPQRRTPFEHLNFQKCSEPGSFLRFRVRNVLRATTACTFSTWQLLKVLRSWGVFCSFWIRNGLRATMACNFSSLIWPAGSAPAALASLLFRPSGTTNHWKNTVFRDFPTFSRTWIFFLLRLSLFWYSFFFSFHLSILSEVWLRNFLRPLTITYYYHS